jgi:hypothetical protein
VLVEGRVDAAASESSFVVVGTARAKRQRDDRTGTVGCWHAPEGHCEVEAHGQPGSCILPVK